MKTYSREKIRIMSYLQQCVGFNQQVMTPMINSVPPSRVTVYQSVHPSINPSLPPSITETGVRLEQSGVLPPSTPLCWEGTRDDDR